MKVQCTLELEFPDHSTASNISRAIELDNAGYVTSRVEGNVLHISAESEDLMSLRNTMDDVLACISVAQKSIEGTD